MKNYLMCFSLILTISAFADTTCVNFTGKFRGNCGVLVIKQESCNYVNIKRGLFPNNYYANRSYHVGEQYYLDSNPEYSHGIRISLYETGEMNVDLTFTEVRQNPWFLNDNHTFNLSSDKMSLTVNSISERNFGPAPRVVKSKCAYARKVKK